MDNSEAVKSHLSESHLLRCLSLKPAIRDLRRNYCRGLDWKPLRGIGQKTAKRNLVLRICAKISQNQYSTLINGFLLDKNHLFGDSRHLDSLIYKLTNITWLLLVSRLGLRWRSYEEIAYQTLERLSAHSKLMEAEQE